MSGDPNFKNPSIAPNFTGPGVNYWKCPRCHSEDVYKAKQQLGTSGPIAEIGDSGNYFGMQRAMFTDIWKCRPCGEIATRFTRAKTPAEKAEEENLGSLWEATPLDVKLLYWGLFAFFSFALIYLLS
jgi:hypothetical protein